MPAIVHHVDMKTDSTGNTAGYKNAAGEQIMLVSGKTNALTGVLESLTAGGNTHLLNPKAALPKTTAAFSRVRAGAVAGFQVANTAVVIIGNSVTRGLGSNIVHGLSTDGARAAWPTQVAKQCRDIGIPVYADSWFGTSQQGSSSAASYKAFDPRWSFTGTPTGASIGSMSLGGQPWIPVNNTFSFLPGTRQTDSLEIWFFGRATYTGTFSINVNGGATIGAAIPSTQESDSYYKSAPTLAALGENTWNVVCSAGTGALVGMVCRNSATPEISIYNVAAGSSLSSAWLPNATFFAAMNGLLALIAHGNATLVHIQLQVNDEKLTTQITPSQLTENLVSIYNTLSAAGAEVTFGSEAPIAISGVNGIPYSSQVAYATAIKSAAAATNCLYLDNFSNFPTYEVGVTSEYGYYQPGELIHPNAVGQALLAQSFTRLMGMLWGN